MVDHLCLSSSQGNEGIKRQTTTFSRRIPSLWLTFALGSGDLWRCKMQGCLSLDRRGRRGRQWREWVKRREQPSNACRAQTKQQIFHGSSDVTNTNCLKPSSLYSAYTEVSHAINIKHSNPKSEISK